MQTALLARFRMSDHGTLGQLFVSDADGYFSCATIELPWKNNQPNISCIPDGVYECVPFTSKKFGAVYHIQNVQGRSWILTHHGNWAGDIEKGLRSDSNGCVLLGKEHATIYGQMGVTLSKTTVRRFDEFMKRKIFEIKVQTLCHGGLV